MKNRMLNRDERKVSEINLEIIKKDLAKSKRNVEVIKKTLEYNKMVWVYQDYMQPFNREETENKAARQIKELNRSIIESEQKIKVIEDQLKNGVAQKESE